MPIYSLFGESNDPSIKPLPKTTMKCKEFDELIAKKFLILPGASFSTYDNPKFKELVTKIAERTSRENNWTILGSYGDFSHYPSMKKNAIKAIDTMHIIAKQKTVTKPTISKIRKDICGEP